MNTNSIQNGSNINRRELLKTSTLLMGGLLLSGISTQAKASTPSMPFKPSELHPLILDSNENSLGMSPNAHQAILKELPNSFRYLRYQPNSPRNLLIETLAKKFGFKQENITLGNGSSETIQSTIQAIITKAKISKKPIQLLIPYPTFEFAQLYAKPFDIPITKIPLNEKMEFDLDKMQASANSFKGISLVYICNPNNPTGIITPSAALEKWVEKTSDKDTFFIFDEAYGEYVENPAFQSAIKWVKAGRKNLIVTKTFSKIYALAGLRIGYGIGNAQTIAEIRKFVELDNINALGGVAALASLQDKEFAKISVNSNKKSRKILSDTLDELKIKYLPSQTNFILYQIKGELKTYQERMKQNHILVGREFPPLTNYNRVTLGTPQEMEFFASTLKSFRKKGWI